MTQTYDVPAQWTNKGSTRDPFRLVNSYAFSKSATALPDQWMHFAKLRALDRKMMAVYLGIALVFTYAFFAMIPVAHAEGHFPSAWIYLAVIAGFALLFWFYVVRAIVIRRTRSAWPHVDGLGIGPSGIAIRAGDEVVDIPWASVSSIHATFTALNDPNPKAAHHPVLLISYAGVRDDGSPGVLTRQVGVEYMGTSPRLLSWALLFYWKSPEFHDELGTTVAQKRLDGWHAQLK